MHGITRLIQLFIIKRQKRITEIHLKAIFLPTGMVATTIPTNKVLEVCLKVHSATTAIITTIIIVITPQDHLAQAPRQAVVQVGTAEVLIAAAAVQQARDHQDKIILKFSGSINQ